MCDFPLCLELRESLDAAFRGEVYEGETAIGEWGLAVLYALQNPTQKGPRPHSLVWHIAHCNLLNITLNCPCEGLALPILRNPEAFLRTTLVLATPQPSAGNPGRPHVVH